MPTLLPHLRSLRNSPTSARDLSQILSPVRLGIWFTFFNLAVAIAFATLFSFISYADQYPDSGDAQIFASVGLGQMFASVLFYAIAIFLTIFIPIRIFGFLIGPRTLRYFDQVVISGISPARYMAGKVILQNLFFLIILAASIPYLALCFSLGDISIPFVLGSIFALWLYTNLLCLATLAASVITFEFVAVPAVILLFALALWIGIFPIPPHVFNISPAQIFAAPAYANMLGDDSFFTREFGPIFALVAPFGLLASHLLFYAATVAFLAACLFLFLSIGPLGAIHGPLNNFGAVVMPGDSKKKRIFRGHHVLRRKGEIAFFYENRPARLQTLDLRLRWGLKEAIFLALLIPSILYIHLFSPLLWAFDFYATLLTAGIFALLINVFIFTRNRATANLRYPKCSAATADTLCFSGNVALIFLLVFALPLLRNEFLNPIPFARTAASTTIFADNFLSIGLLVSLSGFTVYSIAQWLSAHFWSHSRAFTSSLFIYGIFVFIPLIALAVASSTPRITTTEEVFASHAATISPLVPIAYLIEDNGLRLPVTPTIWPFLISHILAATLFFSRARKKRKKSPSLTPS